MRVTVLSLTSSPVFAAKRRAFKPCARISPTTSRLRSSRFVKLMYTVSISRTTSEQSLLSLSKGDPRPPRLPFLPTPGKVIRSGTAIAREGRERGMTRESEA